MVCYTTIQHSFCFRYPSLPFFCCTAKNKMKTTFVTILSLLTASSLVFAGGSLSPAPPAKPHEQAVKRAQHKQRREAPARHNATIETRAPLAQVITSCTVPRTAALTFDDGPYVYMYDISKILLAAGAKGTFFVNGNNYECIYNNAGKRLKYLHSKGHQLASHTVSLPALKSSLLSDWSDLLGSQWSHPDLNTVSDIPLAHFDL